MASSSEADPAHDAAGTSFYVQALYAYSGGETRSLSFDKGDVIEVLTTLSSGWWDGVVCGEEARGWFPSNYVRRISDEEAERICALLGTIAPVAGIASEDDGTDSRQSVSSDEAEDRHPALAAISNLSQRAAPDDASAYPSTAGSASSRAMSPDRQSTGDELGLPVDGGWGDWVPRITSNGQIWYLNVRTGEHANEMPLADMSDVLDQRSETSTGLSMPADADVGERSSRGGLSDDDEADAFFDEHGFGRLRMPAGTPASFDFGPFGARSGALSDFDSEAALGPRSTSPGFSSRVSTSGQASPSVSERSSSLPPQPRPERADAPSPASSFVSVEASRPPSRDSQRVPGVSAGELANARSAPSPRVPAGKGDESAMTLADVDHRVHSALRRVVTCVSDVDATADGHDQLADSCHSLVYEVRMLLQVAGRTRSVVRPDLERASGLGRHSGPGSDVSDQVQMAPSSELRAAQKRVTSELSKLLTCTRAIWSIPGRSVGAQDSNQFAHEARLRRDCVTSAHELAVRLTDFLGLYQVAAGQQVPAEGSITADVDVTSPGPGHNDVDDSVWASGASKAPIRRLSTSLRSLRRLSALHKTVVQHCEQLQHVIVLAASRADAGNVDSVDVVLSTQRLVGSLSALVDAGEAQKSLDIPAGDLGVKNGSTASAQAKATSARRPSNSSSTASSPASPLGSTLQVTVVELKDLAVRLVSSVQGVAEAYDTDSRPSFDDLGRAESQLEAEGCLDEIRDRLRSFGATLSSMTLKTKAASGLRSYTRSSSSLSGSRRSSVSSLPSSDVESPSPRKGRSGSEGPDTASAARVWRMERAEPSALAAGRPPTAATSGDDTSPDNSPTLMRDRPRSSRSPTRSRKLARFFGEETATSPHFPARAVAERPAFLGPDEAPEDVSFNSDGQLRGGTLNALVIKLTSHERPDVAYLRVFLMTYRTFTTSSNFFDLLVQRYRLQAPDGLTDDELRLWADQKQRVVQIRVVNVLCIWLESYLADDEDGLVLLKATEFAANELADPALARQVQSTCERRRANRGPKRIVPITAPGNPPAPVVPRNLRKLKFLDIDALELARQLTLFDSRLFNRIEANECLGKAWPKEFVGGTPHIKAMIDMSNAITRWVAETILSQSDQRKRANTIKHFINVAEKCRNLNNFSTLMQIIAGLNSTPIHRLRRTWESVSQRHMGTLGQLNSTMSPTKSWVTYREHVRNMTPPCVPFLGVYLTDWTFIGDGNPDNLREKAHHINFNKRQKAAELIVQIQSYQSMPYQLTPVPAIVKFIEDHINSQRDEQELFQMSLDIEPREREDEKIARLPVEQIVGRSRLVYRNV